MSAGNLTFSQLVLQVIDDSLSVLGDEPKKAIYQYLFTIHALPKEDIPSRTDDFVSGMKKALGTASTVIERLILKKLYQRIGSTFRESQGLEFGDYVEEAKRRFEVLKQHKGGLTGSLDFAESKKGQSSS